MSELNLVTSLETFSLFSASGLLTVAALAVVLFLNRSVSIPHAERTAIAVLARLPRGRRFSYDLVHAKVKHENLATLWPMALGGWAGVAYLADPEIFVWYLEEAFALWPAYGSLTCWAINAVLALLVAGLAGLGVSFVRLYGAAAGLALTAVALPVALGSFITGVLAGPLALVLLALTGGKAAPFAMPFAGLAKLAGRAFARTQAV